MLNTFQHIVIALALENINLAQTLPSRFMPLHCIECHSQFTYTKIIHQTFRDRLMHPYFPSLPLLIQPTKIFIKLPNIWFDIFQRFPQQLKKLFRLRCPIFVNTVNKLPPSCA
jgi:hypothetical protein